MLPPSSHYGTAVVARPLDTLPPCIDACVADTRYMRGTCAHCRQCVDGGKRLRVASCQRWRCLLAQRCPTHVAVHNENALLPVLFVHL